MGTWKHRKGAIIGNFVVLLCFAASVETCLAPDDNSRTNLDREVINYVDEIFSVDKYNVIPGVGIEAKENSSRPVRNGEECETSRSLQSVEDYFYRKWDQYANTHVVAVNVSETTRFFKIETGKSSFLAGFGMGFLAFAIKKLLLPVFIGAQIVKSVLIAMFLPSILGSLGKLLGKGLSTFSGFSGSSAGLGGGGQTVEDFEFKDTDPYSNNNLGANDLNGEGSYDVNSVVTTPAPDATNRFGIANQRVSYVPSHSDNYYFRQSNKKADYKVFHNIPTSSMMLTSYDPFYSPLLSRLDAVFQQLGLGNAKSPETEKCRERLVCMMYANPGKYAPYSNLVSAQLSRDINELRKPTSDNAEILRFFKYMKAAKDGQDDEKCLTHEGCPSLSAQQNGPAMVTTFNDINKLVQARKLNN